MSPRTTTILLVALLLPACTSPPKERTAAEGGERSTETVRAVETAPEPTPATTETRGLALPTGETATSVVVLETLTPTEVDQNTPFVYTLRVTNVSRSMHVAGVTVTDHLPGEGFAYESSTPAADRAGEMLTWNLGEMRPGETRDLSVRGRASQTGVLVHCGAVTYTPQTCASTRVVAPALALVKTAPAEVLVCDDIPLKFVVSNPGSGAAADVKIVDSLPEGWTVGGRDSVSIDVGRLPAGESREVTVVARASKTGRASSRATATAAGGLSREAGTETIVRQPKLEITKAASVRSQVLGRETTFTVTVKNTGDAAADDLTIVDATAGADAISSISGGGALAGSEVRWNLGRLAPGASRSLTYVANRATPGALSGAATAKAVCAEAVTAAAETVYAGVPAVLLEVVDDPDPVEVGKTTTYTITVTNQGTAPSTNVSIVCEMDPGVELVSTSGASPVAGMPASFRFETIQRLEPKQSAKWTVVVRGTKAGDTRFQVVLTTRETERPVQETEATRFYE